MNNPKVSIIVPSLNVAPYIHKCMDSLLNQTLRDIEVFTIDANSKDGTHEILEDYAKKDDRVILLEDTKGSTGYAKNLGILKARSPYIAIVESDDYVALDMFEKLYSKAEETGADIVKADYSTFVEDDGIDYVFPKSVAAESCDYERIIDPSEDKRCFTWVMYEWLGIYRKDFILKNSIFHNESKGAAYQDTGFWFISLAYAKSIYLMKENFYFYRKDNPYASVRKSNKPFIICNEYDYIQETLSKDEKRLQAFENVYYHGYFHDNMAVYKRTDEKLLPELLQVVRNKMLYASEKGVLDRTLYTEIEWKWLNELLVSTELFHSNRTREFASISENYKDFLNQVAACEDVVIFGAGSYGSNLLYLLKANEIQVEVFVDNDHAKQGKSLNGIQIISPDSCKEKYPNATYLVAHSSKGEEIRQGLMAKGIDENAITVCVLEDIVKSPI